MKRAFVTHHAEFIGGGEHSLLDLLRQLSPEETLLATPSAGALTAEAEAAGIRTLQLPMPPVGWRSLGAIHAWRRWLRQEQPDLIHANSSRAALYAGLACLGMDIPLVFHCRVAERDRWLDWLIVRLASRIVANSRATARRFRPRFAGKIETIYNGIELPAAIETLPGRPAEVPDGRIVLCVARLSRWKRHDLLLAAFELLAAEIPELQLVLLGGNDPFDPGWQQVLRARAAAMSCGNRIHWLGQRGDMANWYAASEVLVLPSREEPFGRVVVEAMAHGVPVVAANAGGPAEIIEPGVSGLLVDDDTPAGWAEALRLVLADASLRDRLIGGGRRRANEFSIERHVAAMLELFARLQEEGK